MSTDSQPAPRQAQSPNGTLPPVRPSMFVRVVMGPMTKVLNPPIARLAGRRHFPMAGQLMHVGRRSGRHYVTPVGARVSGDVVIIPLTFGNQSDWAKNVRAARGCTIRVNGQDYLATEPEFVDRAAVRPLLKPAFSPVERASFGMLGIKQFLRLRVTPAGDVPA